MPPLPSPSHWKSALAPVLSRYRELGVRLEPPLDSTGRSALTAALGADLPPDIAALAEHTSGLRGWGIDLSLRIAVNGAFPPFARITEVPLLGRCIDVGGDGFGNRHLVEPREHGSTVWFLAHDPDVLALAARSVADLLERRLPFVAAVTELEEVHHGEGEQPTSPDHEVHFLEPVPLQGLTGPGADLVRAMAELPRDAVGFDFRAAAAGQAIDLERYPLAQLVRCGDFFGFRAIPSTPKRRWRFW